MWIGKKEEKQLYGNDRVLERNVCKLKRPQRILRFNDA